MNTAKYTIIVHTLNFKLDKTYNHKPTTYLSQIVHRTKRASSDIFDIKCPELCSTSNQSEPSIRYIRKGLSRTGRYWRESGVQRGLL